MTEFRLATRKSPLAIAQASIVARRLSELGHSSSMVEVTTTGDRDRVSSVATLTELGAFVRAVQQAVIDGHADIAVHSGKDLPVDGPEGLLGVHIERASPWDVLCGASLSRLPEGARVGTGSPRRGAQLRLLRPDVEVVDIRGNVATRLDLTRSGDLAAVILAEAGLIRQGLSDAIDHRFSLTEMVPAPAQAALAIEAAAGSAAAGILADLEDVDVARAVSAERELLAITGAGCRSALGAYAVVGEGGGIRMTGFVDDDDGPRRAEVEADTPARAARRMRGELAL